MNEIEGDILKYLGNENKIARGICFSLFTVRTK